jgi:hypothetical protein
MLLTGAIAAAAAGATAPSASAGTYRVFTCKTPAGTPTSTDGWRQEGFNAGPGQWDDDSCASGGLLRTFMSGDSAWTGNTWKGWSWNAPANTSIAGASVRYTYASNAGGDTGGAGLGWWMFRNSTDYTGANVVATCHAYAGFGDSRGTAGIGESSSFGIATGCLGNPTGWCAAGHRIEAQIDGATVDLRDAADPNVTSSAGTLLEPRTLTGTESLSWTGTDAGSGLWESEVKIGPTVVVPRSTVDGNGGRCSVLEGGFGWPVPCKLSASQNLSIDTTTVPDGTYPLTATVWDAANNASTIASKRITIDNIPAPAIKPAPSSDNTKINDPRVEGEARVGALLTAFDGNWTDASAQLTRVWQQADSVDGPWTTVPASVGPTYRPNALMAGKFVRISVTAVSKEGTTTVSSAARAIEQASGGSLALLTANNGTGGDPATGKLVPSKKRTKAKVAFKKTVKVAGKLVDAAGTPISGAQIDAFETVAPSGARSKVGTVTTDSRGRYSWAPATRSNRVVDLAYSRQKGSDNYQSTQSLQVLVRAGISIKLKRPRIRARGTGVLTGRVVVDGLPTTGIRVEIHSRGARGRDLVIGTAKTDGNGRFKWSHRFDASYGFVPLSVKVLSDRDMPALGSRSRQVRLLIG